MKKHSFFCNCIFCRTMRKELSDRQIYLLIAAIFGAVLAFSYWR